MLINVNDLSLLLGVLSIITAGAIWVMTLINKTSIRAATIERDLVDIEKRVDKVEEKTDRTYQEKVIIDVFAKATNSKEFKQSLKEIIKDTIIHLDRNRSAAEAHAFDVILQKLVNLENEMKHP